MRTRLPAVLLLAALALSACSTAGGTPVPTTGGTSAPEASADPSPAGEGVAHPTGADEIVLRFDEAGGLMFPEWFAAHAPYFTLYGDGTAVFTDSSATVPQDPGGAVLNPPLRTARLTEDQVQALLAYAIRDAGLGVAKAEYQNPLVADAPTATFEINYDGGSRTVSVVALGMEDMEPTPDTPIKQALAELGTRLRDFGQGGSLQSAPYVPTAYRGTLTEAEGLEGVAFRDWPWTDLTPADFAKPADPMALPQAKAVLTPAQAEALGVEGFEGGIAGGVYLKDADGKTYTFALRPLLPDETE